MKFVNTAPANWTVVGGAHWILESASGLKCSAFRPDTDSKWTVLDCYSNKSALWLGYSSAEIKGFLAELVEIALEVEKEALAAIRKSL